MSALAAELHKTNLDSLTSKHGWTYCLQSECGRYIKIGKTSQRILRIYLGTSRFYKLGNHPSIGGKMSCEYVNGFKCKWAVSSDTFEDAYHRALDEYRCIYLELDHNGKGVERSPIHSRYLTKDEAESLPRFDRSEVPASWSNVKRNKALSKSGLDRCDKRPNIELFKISAKSALKQIDNSIGLPFMDRQNYKPRF